MLLKLVMPSVDRLMRGGVIGKWHKSEGDHVGYGDDLLDLNAEITMNVLDNGTMEQRIRLLKNGGSVRDEDLAGIANEKTLVLAARVTASDSGTLSRIDAREGTYREVGGMLAVLSTDDAGRATPADEDLTEASEFRVVANLVG